MEALHGICDIIDLFKSAPAIDFYLVLLKQCLLYRMYLDRETLTSSSNVL